MTDEELAEIEDRNDNRWRAFGSHEKGYIDIRDLIAEVRRLRAENERLEAKVEDIYRDASMNGFDL